MFLHAPADTDTRARLCQANRDELGFVMNLTKVWAWRPDVSQAFAALRALLIDASTLTPREQAVIVCASAATLGDAYCSLAWGTKLASASSSATAAAVLAGHDGEGLTRRENALGAWARKVVEDPNGTTAQDVQALRASGLLDAEIFDATALTAFRLAFSTINDALGAEPDQQVAQAAPAAVRQVVCFGRRSANESAQVPTPAHPNNSSGKQPTEGPP